MKKILSLVLSIVIAITLFNGVTVSADEDVAYKDDYLAARVEIKDYRIFVTQPYWYDGRTTSNKVEITTPAELKTFASRIVFGELQTVPESYDYTSGEDYGKIYMCDYVSDDFESYWMDEFESYVEDILISDEDELDHYDIEELAYIWERAYHTSVYTETEYYQGYYRYNILRDMEDYFEKVAVFFNEDGSLKDDVFNEESAKKYNAKVLFGSIYAFSDVEFMDVPNTQLLYLMYEYERVMSNPICYIASGGCEYNPDIRWEIYGKGVLEISGEGEICEDCAFREYEQQIRVCKINEGITSVGDYTFYGNFPITEITLPDTLIEIGDLAFKGLYIREINIPDSVETIGCYAFDSCFYLKSISLPENLYVIENSVFEQCGNLVSVDIPEGVGYIMGYAFYDCDSLKDIKIPSSVKYIDERAFGDCDLLESLTVSEDNEYYYSSGNCIVEKATKTLVTACKNFVIPTGRKIENIGYRAFLHLDGFTELVIPDGVKKIGQQAFYGTDIASITLPNSLEVIEAEAFSGVPVENVYYKGTESEWENIITGRSNEDLLDATIHFETRPSSEAPCNGISWETSYSGTLKLSGTGTVCADCGFTAFPGYIKKCDIGNGIEAIGESAFLGCYMLTEVNIPSTVMLIDEGAFNGCTFLYDIYYHGTEAEWNEITINEDLTGVTIHFVEPEQGFSISGTVKCYGDENEKVTIELRKDGQLVAVQKYKGNLNTYSFKGLDKGDYTIIVYKTNYTASKHCSRWYSNIGCYENITKDLEIRLYGDVTGDGTINGGDALQINRKIANMSSIFDTEPPYGYLTNVGNITGLYSPGPDLDANDILQIRRKIANMPSLFDTLE